MAIWSAGVDAEGAAVVRAKQREVGALNGEGKDVVAGYSEKQAQPVSVALLGQHSSESRTPLPLRHFWLQYANSILLSGKC